MEYWDISEQDIKMARELTLDELQQILDKVDEGFGFHTRKLLHVSDESRLLKIVKEVRLLFGIGLKEARTVVAKNKQGLKISFDFSNADLR